MPFMFFASSASFFLIALALALPCRSRWVEKRAGRVWGG